MAEKSIIEGVRRYIKALDDHGVSVRFVVLYGSQAAGAAGRWSDIDVLVVSPRFDSARRRSDIELLWRVAARVDSRIEPVPCGEQQWYEDDSSTIIEIARRHGERIEPVGAIADD